MTDQSHRPETPETPETSETFKLPEVPKAPELPQVNWAEGDRRVTWTYRGAMVEKQIAEPPRAVVAWDDYVLVIEVMPGQAEPKRNAVVFRSDGSEWVRLRAPKGKLEELWIIGFYSAYLDELGPVVVLATQVGDFWGRVDISEATLTDVRQWR